MAHGQEQSIFVSVNGNDDYPGTFAKPLKTIQKAIEKAKRVSGAVSVQLMAGTYYVPKTIEINNQTVSPAGMTTIKAYGKDKVVISGGRTLTPKWHTFKSGIYMAFVPDDFTFEQLFVDGKPQTLARYPNAGSGTKVFKGTAEDATLYVRVQKWGNPYGGYVHALDETRKGSLHYKITGVDDTDNVELDGGWQNKNPLHFNKNYHFVENILAELDEPGEWYLDNTLHILYYFPASYADLKKSVFEASHLQTIFKLSGEAQKPVSHIRLSGLNFQHTERSFMDSREILPGSDWAVNRIGAIVLENTADNVIDNCSFQGLGGNGVVLSGYNKNITIEQNDFKNIGATGVALIGRPLQGRVSAVSDKVLIKKNVLSDIGLIEKQGKGIFAFEASDLLIENNSVSGTPGKAIFIQGNALNVKLQNNRISNEFQELFP